MSKDIAVAYALKRRNSKRLKGAEQPQTENTDMSIADAIRKKRKKNEALENNMETPSMLPELQEEAMHNDPNDIMDGMDMGFESTKPEIESDKYDRVSRIRAKLRGRK